MEIATSLNVASVEQIVAKKKKKNSTEMATCYFTDTIKKFRPGACGWSSVFGT